MSIIGKRIKELRRQNNLTQEELAEKLGVTRAVVANWEIDRALPDVYMLCRLAELFHLSVDRLLGRTEAKPSEQMINAARYLSVAEANSPYITSSLSSRHQEILTALLLQIGQFLHGKTVKIFPFPFNVNLLIQRNENNEGNKIYETYIPVQPDLTILSNLSRVNEHGYQGTPDWLIEIISPHTLKLDMQDKLSLYEQAAVPEYWIVHPQEQTVLVFQLQGNNKYGTYQFYTAEDEIKVRLFEGLTINLGEIFK